MQPMDGLLSLNLPRSYVWRYWTSLLRPRSQASFGLGSTTVEEMLVACKTPPDCEQRLHGCDNLVLHVVMWRIGHRLALTELYPSQVLDWRGCVW